GVPLVHPAIARRVQLRQGFVHGLPERLGERPHRVLRGDAFRFGAHPGGRAEHHADGEGDHTVIPILPLLLLQSASVDRARVPDAPATVTATRVAPASRPVLDGRLADPARTLATPLGGLLQRDPQEGAPATQRADVRILYDAA